jgi:type I restriction enzyme S subunit
MMNSNWEKVKLGEVLTFQRGYDLTHNEMKGGEIPVVGSSEIIGYHNESKVKSPVLLIGRSGTVGRPQFYEQDIWAHNTTLFVSDFHGNNPKFCFSFLKYLNLQDYASASGVPTLNRNFIHPLKVNLPDLPTQRRIAAVLSCLDEKIALNNRINDNLTVKC